jgi:hypothetical protein
MGWPDMAERATASGMTFADYRHVEPFPEGVPLDSDWERMMDMLCGENTQRDVADALRTWKADVALVDCMMATSFAPVFENGVKSAALCHVLYRPFAEVWGSMALGMDVGAELAACDLVLVPVLSDFDLPGAVPSNVHHVGPILALGEDAEVRLDSLGLGALAAQGDPWVLVSLSTTDMEHRAALDTIAEALGTLPVRALLTLGGAYPEDSVDAPANCVVRGFVPHEVVLPRVDLVVTHAGLSTVSAALAEGKALVCIPQGRDQTLNAERVAACGLGIALDKDAPAASIAESVERVLADETYRSNAHTFKEKTDVLGRGARAVELMTDLAAR